MLEYMEKIKSILSGEGFLYGSQPWPSGRFFRLTCRKIIMEHSGISLKHLFFCIVVRYDGLQTGIVHLCTVLCFVRILTFVLFGFIYHIFPFPFSFFNNKYDRILVFFNNKYDKILVFGVHFIIIALIFRLKYQPAFYVYVI